MIAHSHKEHGLGRPSETSLYGPASAGAKGTQPQKEAGPSSFTPRTRKWVEEGKRSLSIKDKMSLHLKASTPGSEVQMAERVGTYLP